jgi:hypothetical protein
MKYILTLLALFAGNVRADQILPEEYLDQTREELLSAAASISGGLVEVSMATYAESVGELAEAVTDSSMAAHDFQEAIEHLNKADTAFANYQQACKETYVGDDYSGMIQWREIDRSLVPVDDCSEYQSFPSREEIPYYGAVPTENVYETYFNPDNRITDFIAEYERDNYALMGEAASSLYITEELNKLRIQAELYQKQSSERAKADQEAQYALQDRYNAEWWAKYDNEQNALSAQIERGYADLARAESALASQRRAEAEKKAKKKQLKEEERLSKLTVEERERERIRKEEEKRIKDEISKKYDPFYKDRIKK